MRRLLRLLTWVTLIAVAVALTRQVRERRRRTLASSFSATSFVEAPLPEAAPPQPSIASATAVRSSSDAVTESKAEEVSPAERVDLADAAPVTPPPVKVPS